MNGNFSECSHSRKFPFIHIYLALMRVNKMRSILFLAQRADEKARLKEPMKIFGSKSRRECMAQRAESQALRLAILAPHKEVKMSGEIFKTVISFPFKQLGELLRSMSLSSNAGNIGAWVLYIAICLIPVAILLLKLVKKKVYKEDLLLIVISAALFYVMYVMINPSTVFRNNYLTEDYDAEISVFGGFIYSAIVGYIVLKLVRAFSNAEKAKICKWINGLLLIVNIVLALSAVLGVETLIDNIEAVKEKNYSSDDLSEYMDIPEEFEFLGLQNEFDVDDNIALTNIFLFVRYLVGIIPCITTIIVIVFVQRFIKDYGKNGVAQETIVRAKRVQKVSVKAVVINVLVNVSYNLVQLVFYKDLLNTYANVELPLTSLIFILAMPLITKLIVESKEIKEENEMFV